MHPWLDEYEGFENAENTVKSAENQTKPPPGSMAGQLWQDFMQSIYDTVAGTRVPKFHCPYYESLKLQSDRPEIRRALDFIARIGYTSPNGERVFEQPRGGDTIYLVECIEGDRPLQKLIDCHELEDLRSLIEFVCRAQSKHPQSLRFLIVPQLSPVIIEILGYTLELDFGTLSKHFLGPSDMFCLHQFYQLNRSPGENVHDDLELPAKDSLESFTVWHDFDLSVAGGGRLDFVDLENTAQRSFSFVRRRLRAWPRTFAPDPMPGHEPLRRFFYGHSRTTVHVTKHNSKPSIVMVLLTPLLTKQHLEERFAPPVVAEPSLFEPSCRGEEDIAHIASVCDGEIAQRVFAAQDQPGAACQVPFLWTLTKQLELFAKEVDRDRVRTYLSLQQVTNASHKDVASGVEDQLAATRLLEDVLMHRLNEIQERRYNVKSLEKSESSTGEPDQFQRIIKSYLIDSEKLESSINTLLERLRVAQNRMLSDQQSRLTRLQIEESRTSIRQNDQVRKLTALAFLFIPTSAVTSAFGMNVSELLNDPPKVWIPVVTLIAVTLSAIFFAGSGFLANFVRGVDRLLRKRRSIEHVPGNRLAEYFSYVCIYLVYPLKIFKYSTETIISEGEQAEKNRQQEKVPYPLYTSIIAPDVQRARNWRRTAMQERRMVDGDGA